VFNDYPLLAGARRARSADLADSADSITLLRPVLTRIWVRVSGSQAWARASLQRRQPPTDEREPAPAPDSTSEQALVAEFVRTYESGDLDALVALLTDDIHVSMPPIPFEYQGRDVVARLFASIFRSDRRVDLVPTRANGQPAFGAYLRASTGIRHGTGLFVLALIGDRICAFTRFDNSVLPWFGLPRSLPSR
jgi:hypothetical protein